jgi:flavin-dependent dehydrogenase
MPDTTEISDMSEHDVVVVGGRVAGAATALLLARAGCDVLVLERSRYGTDTVSTHALLRAGVLQLDRWGVLDAIVAAGTPPIRRNRFHFGDGPAFEVPLVDAAGVPALYAPRRTLLDTVLVDAARAAGAQFRYGVSVRDVARDGGRVVGVSGHDVNGRPFAARGRITVGADGARSTIARLVDAPVTRTGTAAAAVVYGYFDLDADDSYDWHYGQRLKLGRRWRAGESHAPGRCNTLAQGRGFH